LSNGYWHIGKTAMRLRNTTSFSRNSWNRLAYPSLPLQALVKVPCISPLA
jgi:hypothetical protein